MSQCVLEGIPFVDLEPLKPNWHELMPRARKCPQWFQIGCWHTNALGTAAGLCSLSTSCGGTARESLSKVCCPLVLGTGSQERWQAAASIPQLWRPATPSNFHFLLQGLPREELGGCLATWTLGP